MDDRSAPGPPLPARSHPQGEYGEGGSLRSLAARRAPLASPAAQQAVLAAVDLSHARFGGEFETALAAAGWAPLRAAAIDTFQINLGKLCNMTCRHCHVDAGPDRTREVMDRTTVDLCLAALDRTSAHTVDLTGGAPELNPHFRYLVEACADRGKHVIDRCNLTVLLTPAGRDLPEWLGERGVEVVCSLPHWRRRSTDAQRGEGSFEKSVTALRRLNLAGYGQCDPQRTLTVVVNPTGAFLPGDQAPLERQWRESLEREHGVRFDRLIALTNMPIARFLEWLVERGGEAEYLELLTSAFNPTTVPALMCRNTLSVSWDGRLFDCDFNQMLDLDVTLADGATLHVGDLAPERLLGRAIRVGRHCFGCTAGAGSSCGGALAEQP